MGVLRGDRAAPALTALTEALSAGGAAVAGGASPGLGLALRQLGDRARLLSFLVARLREKVPPELCAGGR